MKIEVLITPIPHHSPSPGYKYLWVESEGYPKKSLTKSVGCKHEETKDFWVSDSDPGWMKTTYKHTVCTHCGKLLKVNGESYKDMYFENSIGKREPCQGEKKIPRFMQLIKNYFYK